MGYSLKFLRSPAENVGAVGDWALLSFFPGKAKKICMFTVTRPTLIFASDPINFYTELG